MTFQVQGRTFLVPNHNTFNLKRCGIPNGFSLYNGKSRQYLCPDKHGNVEIKKDGKYLIRKIFNAKSNDKLMMAKMSPSDDVKKEKTTNEDMILKTSNANKKCNDKNKDDDNDGNKGSNPFLKFCHEYKENNKERKVLVKELKEKWNQLDDTTKKEKYGWNDNEIANNNIKKINGSSFQKRKKDDTITDENDSTKKQKTEKYQEVKNNKKENQLLQKTKQESSTKTNETKKKDKKDDDFGSLFDSLSSSDSD